MSSTIVEKIRKLMAIAGDGAASEAEIENALRHAQRMMDAHHLTEADLAHEPQDDFAAVDRATFNRYRSFVGSKVYHWEGLLASYVAMLVGIGVYTEGLQIVRKNGVVQFNERGKRYVGVPLVFYGIDEDAQLATQLYDELRLMIASMARLRWGQVYRGEGGAYCDGFVSGLILKLDESRESEKEAAQKLLADSTDTNRSHALILIERRTALVEYKREKADDWIAKRGVRLGKRRRTSGSLSGSDQAYNEGRTDGRATDVTATRRRKLTQI